MPVLVRSRQMGQVRFNQESTERQYNLASKASLSGWSSERIRILDPGSRPDVTDARALAGSTDCGKISLGAMPVPSTQWQLGRPQRL